MFSRSLKWLTLLLTAALLLAGLAYGLVQKYLDTPLTMPEGGFIYHLEKGGTLGQLAYHLAEGGHLQSPRLLLFYSRITGHGNSIKRGEYEFAADITPRQLITQLEQGAVKYYQLTIVEGWTFQQVLNVLQQQNRLVDREKLSPDEIATHLNTNKQPALLEGYFFPDTYLYYKGMSALELLQQSYRKMQTVLAEEWAQRAEGLPYQSPYEALIMASIVEKETGDPTEREQIAGVFVRRLQKNMRLQTDPSVIYGLGVTFDGNLTVSHLRDVGNPYNTYRHNGLPPTPIALPGRAAIYAALHPATGNSLYFVAKGDGSHYFSETLAEHQQAVRKYQIQNRRKDYRSKPLPQ